MKEIFLYCVDCRVKMKNTGETLFLVGHPPKHIYYCPVCGDKYFSKDIFMEEENKNE